MVASCIIQRTIACLPMIDYLFIPIGIVISESSSNDSSKTNAEKVLRTVNCESPLVRLIRLFCFFIYIGCRHGSFQRPGTLAESDDYIERSLFYGAYFSIQVPAADTQDVQCKYSCEFKP